MADARTRKGRIVLGEGSLAGACCAAIVLLTAAPSCSTKVRSFDEAGAAGGGGSAASGGGGDAAASGGGGGRPCDPGSQDACYGGPPGTLNRGACRAGVRACDEQGEGYGPCAGQVLPAPDRCDTAEDEDCDGVVNKGCTYARCGDVPRGLPSDVYALDPDGPGPEPEFDAYCDLVTDGGGWALLYNSVGSEAGKTLPFWNIPYAERLGTRGEPAPGQNFYRGSLYLVGREYRDEIEDLEGTVEEVLRATAEGIDAETMRLLRPAHVAGSADIFVAHFMSGWSSRDHDGDPSPGNCALLHQNVTQHYAQCWEYNLGSDADDPFNDGGWGPHLGTHIAERLALASDGTLHTRVRRISRWTRW
ncbi:fibrinogen-like YCDxxxxGGGW domain-containing protein [Sorangium sp. So ce176]|uniref:fibrinogen-like YCDxxxxGGGW domain-containing protein n=1 Tax=Sorangium sp. So ce176 TaxID=3133286 RepID=UPI003F5E506C